jgi:hypothetical protein
MASVVTRVVLRVGRWHRRRGLGAAAASLLPLGEGTRQLRLGGRWGGALGVGRLALALVVAVLALVVPAAGRDPGGATGATILFRSPAVAEAQGGPNRAGLVIRYSDGRSETRCVDFVEAQISGYELLRRSGLPLAVAQGPQGTGICRIGGDGCDPAQCLTCRGGSLYWSYFHMAPAGWQYSTIGAADYQVRPGALDGWTYSNGVRPPEATFAQVCPAQPAPTPVVPTATATLVPSSAAPAVRAGPAPPPIVLVGPASPVAGAPSPTATALAPTATAPIPTATAPPPTATPAPASALSPTATIAPPAAVGGAGAPPAGTAGPGGLPLAQGVAGGPTAPAGGAPAPDSASSAAVAASAGAGLPGATPAAATGSVDAAATPAPDQAPPAAPDLTTPAAPDRPTPPAPAAPANQPAASSPTVAVAGAGQSPTAGTQQPGAGPAAATPAAGQTDAGAAAASAAAGQSTATAEAAPPVVLTVRAAGSTPTAAPVAAAAPAGPAGAAGRAGSLGLGHVLFGLASLGLIVYLAFAGSRPK